MRVGSAAVDLAPGRDLDLDGYDWRWSALPSGNAGVRDPLRCQATVFRDGERTAVLVCLDMLLQSVALTRRWRAVAARAAGVEPDAVIIACSHTHSAPCVADPDATELIRRLLPSASVRTGIYERFRDEVEAAIALAVAQAAALCLPVRLAAAAAPCALAYGRRVTVGGQVRYCWNPRESPDLFLHAAPTGDPTLCALWCRGEGGRDRVLWSAGAHPVTLGRTSRIVSADWPGAARRTIAERTGAEACFLLGACGDTHPWIATQADANAVEVVGALAGSMVCALGAAAAAGPDQGLRMASRTWRRAGHELDLAAWRLGPALLLAAPVELFAGLGAELRRRLPLPALLATNANGWTGYWPDAAAFAAGGYEAEGAAACGLAPGDGEALIDAWAELAGRVLP